jgi:peptidoglycan/LPS O-acetylase OafA/YrhL
MVLQAIGAIRMTTNVTAETRYYPNFDILRLLLAAEVVFDHARYYLNPNSIWDAPVMAVPAFLAISGFLVLKSFGDSGSWLVFLRKRALRILPALALSMVLCLFLFNWFAVYNSLLNWLTGGIYTLNGVANGPLWSLAWEELAYVLLAVLWALGAYRKPWCIWALLVAALYVVHRGRHEDPHLQIILFLGPAFFTGNLMFLYRKALLKVNQIIPWLFMAACVFNGHIPVFNKLVAMSPVMFQSASIVWVGMAGLRIIPFKFPDLSYGIYIYHVPIILFLIGNGWVTSGYSMALLLSFPLIGLSVASWYLVEKPALRLKNLRHEQNRHAIPPVAVGTDIGEQRLMHRAHEAM